MVRSPAYDSVAGIVTHRDKRGHITHVEWTGPSGQRMLTFPGDYPGEDQYGALYTVKAIDGTTQITLYGKPADAKVDDPVWRAVIEEDGTFVSFDRVSAHTGDPRYWGVPPDDRGKSVYDM